MTIQSMVAVGFIMLSVCNAALSTLYRVSDHLGWIIASALVALGGNLALWLAPDWAGWLTATLFVLLIASPQALLNRARLADQRGQWKKAARLHRWAFLLHPSPWTHFGLILRRALSADGPRGYVAALTQIDATGSSPKQKALARLRLAYEQRHWESLLMLSRAGDVAFSEAKPHEIRALGELGRLDEMVRMYQNAAKWLMSDSRQGCMLFVFAFTGRVERVQQLLDGPLSAINDDSKKYWIAVARLRTDHNDQAARSMLTKLSETGAPDGVRRSAVQQLQRAYQESKALPPLAEETERIVDGIIQGPWNRLRAQQERRQRVKWSTKVHVRGLMLLILIIIMAVIQRYYR